MDFFEACQGPALAPADVRLVIVLEWIDRALPATLINDVEFFYQYIVAPRSAHQ